VRSIDDIITAVVVEPFRLNETSSSNLDRGRYSSGSPNVAAHVGAGQVLDGAVAGGLTNIRSSTGTCKTRLDISTLRDCIHMWDKLALVDTIDPEINYARMCAGESEESRSSERGKQGALHIGQLWETKVMFTKVTSG